MIKVVVVGCGGRMGGEISRLLTLQTDMKLVGGVEAAGHPQIGTPLGAGIITTELQTFVNDVDVVVDFSLPEAVVKNIRLCAERGIPYITGVTGLDEKQFAIVRAAGDKIPVVWSANFALGVAVLARLANEAVSLLGAEYDIHIIEMHHRKKRDAPSGTARQLLEGLRSAASQMQIPVISIRTGEVVGEHRIIFGGAGERLELVHKAESRTAFASGVINAIRWIVKRPAGFYSMADILNLR